MLKKITKDLFSRDQHRMETGSYTVGNIRVFCEFTDRYEYTRHKRPLRFIARKNSHGAWSIKRAIKSSSVTSQVRTVATGLDFDEAFSFLLIAEMEMAAEAGKLRIVGQFADYIRHFSGGSSHICAIAQKHQRLAVRVLMKTTSASRNEAKKNEAKKRRTPAMVAAKGAHRRSGNCSTA